LFVLGLVLNRIIQSPAHTARHPWGKIPAIEFADGFTLYESRAICRHLTTIYALPLIPPANDLRATALFDQAQSIESLYFQEAAGKIAFEKIAKKMIGIPTDDKAVASAVESLKSFFSLLDRILEKQKYMAGNNFSLIDIFYIPLIVRLFACDLGDLVTSKKAIDAWWQRCYKRPAIRDLLEQDQVPYGKQ
jgi:glutathione S-transferase